MSKTLYGVGINKQLRVKSRIIDIQLKDSLLTVRINAVSLISVTAG